MSLYSVDKVMYETRRLASQYHQMTGQVLPVSHELAKYDAMRLLGLKTDETNDIDAIGVSWEKDKLIQIRGRVIFDKIKKGQRIGQLNLEGLWDITVLVILDSTYSPFAIYAADRQSIIEAVSHKAANHNRARRGVLSVAKFKMISELVWQM